MNIGISNSKISLVADENYHPVIDWLTLRAKRRIYANLFIVDLLHTESSKEKEHNTKVIDLLNNLRLAKLRGVRVRLIIGGSNSSHSIQDITETSFKYCQILNIPCNLAAQYSDSYTHKKVVVVDDWTLIGSHNWSPGAFSGQIQDSVLVEDNRLASYFFYKLGEEWLKLEKRKDNALL